MAAAAWESSGVSSTIRIITLKEEPAWTAGTFLKEEWIRSLIHNRNFIQSFSKGLVWTDSIFSASGRQRPSIDTLSSQILPKKITGYWDQTQPMDSISGVRT